LEANSIETSTICNGVDTEKFKVTDLKCELRKKLCLPMHTKMFISVGSLDQRKNPLLIIDAFKKLHGDYTMVFLGNGYGKSSVEDDCLRAASMDARIFFTGKVANVAEYLNCADYFVSASYSEGLPNTVIEALACGLPVCLSDIPPHREILNFNPDAGQLFKPGDSEELYSCLVNLTHSDYDSYSSAAIKIIADKLSAEMMAFNYMNFYN
jgi:glycosyltransferase involved in cell wall biosynthesis